MLVRLSSTIIIHLSFLPTILSVDSLNSFFDCGCVNTELTSSMPFAGGAYGLARVTLGLWPGTHNSHIRLAFIDVNPSIPIYLHSHCMNDVVLHLSRFHGWLL